MSVFTLTEARELIRNATGEDDNTLTDTKCDMMVNLSYRALLDTYAFREKEVEADVPTVLGQADYDMPDPSDALRQINIFDPDSLVSSILDPMTVDEYTAKKLITTSDAYGFPTNYVRESNLYHLWPTPDAVYDTVVKYWGIITDISDLANTIDIPQVWWPAILDGGIVNVFKYHQGDIERAAAYTRFQAKVVSDIVPTAVKEEENYHRAGLQVLRNTEL
jgi:hypothetical protein